MREALAAALRARLSSIKNRMMDMRLDAWPRGLGLGSHLPEGLFTPGAGRG